MKTDNILTKVKSFLLNRKRAYQFTFNDENIYARAVLKDLAKFCRAEQSAFHEDPRLHALIEGRREVWLRIQNYLNLSPDELWDLYRKE